MNILFLILGLTTASTSYELIKIPVGMVAKQITCDQAFHKYVKFVSNPNYKPNSMDVWINAKYKGKTVLFHYCKDTSGKWKQ
jgi:hypothetical protein